ncbi:MAG: radical SAM protein [Butyricicoccus sp.]|nr:radical SAM protein [Butyricicoccus sp.]
MISKADFEQLAHRPIILFPFGRDGKAALDTFLAHGYTVRAIWDNRKYGQTYQGIPVEQPEAITDEAVAVVLCAGASIQEMLLAQAQSLCPTVYLGGDVLRSMDLTHREYGNNFMLINQSIESEWSQDHPHQLVLHSLELPITDRCSLRCRDCSNLMQYFTAPKDADIEQALADADQVLDSVDRIEQLRLLGGEPFVSRHLYRYVQHFAGHDKIEFIHIFSNGTIVPTGENLECLKHPKVFVNISNYGPLSRHIPEIEALFQREHILYRVADVTEWTDCASITEHHRSPERLAQVFGDCCASRLLTLRGGRLFICPFLANAQALHAIPAAADESLLLSQYSKDELTDALQRFLAKTSFRGCDFCNGRPRGVVNIPAAVQAKEPRSYRRYDVE